MFAFSEFAKPIHIRAGICFGCLTVFLFVTGCANSCYFGVVNPPNNSLTVIGGPNTVCSLSQMPANVTVAAQLAPVCTGCSGTRQVKHVQLLVSGIELHPGAVADEDSPEWQELAPDLAQHPRMFDLTEESSANDLAAALYIAGHVPAGTYYQLRLRLAGKSSTGTGELSAANLCSSNHASCVIDASGNAQEIRTSDGKAYLRVEVSTPLNLHAGRLNQLRIEFAPEWGLQNSSGGVLDVLPYLRGHVVDDFNAAAAQR